MSFCTEGSFNGIIIKHSRCDYLAKCVTTSTKSCSIKIGSENTTFIRPNDSYSFKLDKAVQSTSVEVKTYTADATLVTRVTLTVGESCNGTKTV